MKFATKVDSNGFKIDTVLVADNAINTSNIIVDKLSGLFKPKWDGTKWIETMPLNDVEIIRNTNVLSIEQQNKADIQYIALMMGVEL